MGKGYFKRVLSMCKPWELVYWWTLRILMIGGIILRLVEADELGMYQPMQMAALVPVSSMSIPLLQVLATLSTLMYVTAIL